MLTIGRVLQPTDGAPVEAPEVEVVRHYAWQGAPHDVLYGALLSLLRETWRVRHVTVDATGIGETVAGFLEKSLPGGAVTSQKLSAQSKSQLGFGLLTAVNGGRLRLYADDGSAELRQCLAQLAACRAAYRANQTLNFYVEPRDGHDDYVISLALLVAAAASALPRRARGRVREGFG